MFANNNNRSQEDKSIFKLVKSRFKMMIFTKDYCDGSEKDQHGNFKR